MFVSTDGHSKELIFEQQGTKSLQPNNWTGDSVHSKDKNFVDNLIAS